METQKVNGLTEGQRTLRRRTIQFEGVKLMNIPPPFQNFSGKVETFKFLLDIFLSLVPDEPPTQTLSPKASDCYGKPSNSLYDWCKNRMFEWVLPLELRKIDKIYILKCKNDAECESS